VRSKRFIKFCERFEKFWFEFELKRFDFAKSLKNKKKKKKRKLSYLSAQRPTGPHKLLPQRPASAPSILFPPQPLTPGPHLSAPPSPSFLPFPFPGFTDRAPPRSSPRLAASSTFSFPPSKPIKTIIPRNQIPFRFLLFSPSLAPLRRVARRPSMARPLAAFPPSVPPLFLPLSLFKVEPELSLSLSLLFALASHLHALDHHLRPALPPYLRRRWRRSSPVKGSPPPSLLSIFCCVVAH
jgi:hypothetical protein